MVKGEDRLHVRADVSQQPSHVTSLSFDLSEPTMLLNPSLRSFFTTVVAPIQCLFWSVKIAYLFLPTIGVVEEAIKVVPLATIYQPTKTVSIQPPTPCAPHIVQPLTNWLLVTVYMVLVVACIRLRFQMRVNFMSLSTLWVTIGIPCAFLYALHFYGIITSKPLVLSYLLGRNLEQGFQITQTIILLIASMTTCTFREWSEKAIIRLLTGGHLVWIILIPRFYRCRRRIVLSSVTERLVVFITIAPICLDLSWNPLSQHLATMLLYGLTGRIKSLLHNFQELGLFAHSDEPWEPGTLHMLLGPVVIYSFLHAIYLATTIIVTLIRELAYTVFSGPLRCVILVANTIRIGLLALFVSIVESAISVLVYLPLIPYLCILGGTWSLTSSRVPDRRYAVKNLVKNSAVWKREQIRWWGDVYQDGINGALWKDVPWSCLLLVVVPPVLFFVYCEAWPTARKIWRLCGRLARLLP
ncbi:hypothetical protein MIND_00663800 [Mycena indigotica]|uniref:Uncharacterized protein n=1 Tax=Mycena indigotica TaxID=2126181 RepID=A0A8H6W0I2_9AGAR|nr:uncharacterized protein MIND_00663800 [Mycena indigotica]KAF7301004.1 hypothetical protein MIND_00663800 [Mycena indigotica]